MRLMRALILILCVSRASAQTCAAGQYQKCNSCVGMGPMCNNWCAYVAQDLQNYPQDAQWICNEERCALCCECAPYCSNPLPSVCTSCDAGTYSNGGSATACTNCAAGKSSAAGQSWCTDCAAGKYSGCESQPGWYPDGGYPEFAGQFCGMVPNYGEYSAIHCQEDVMLVGNVPACDACCECAPYCPNPRNPNSACISCPVGKYSGATGASTQSTCTACTSGKYSGATGAYISSTCTNCPANSYSDTGAGACTACEAGKTSTAGASVCVSAGCAAGTYVSGGGCTNCPPGSYSVVVGASACTGCSAGQYSTATGASAAATCLACPASSYSPISSAALAACTCNVGFTGPNGGPCTACVAGTYKIATGSAVCTNCLAGTYSGVTSASSASACVSCPAGTTSPSGSTWSTACASTNCNAGFTGPTGGPCTACVAGKYKTTSGSVTCTDCGAGSYSTSTAATISATCIQCPSNSISYSASSAVGDCTCNAGFTGPNGGPCTACVAGKYKTTSGSAACTDCGTGSYISYSASSAAGDCTCNAGFTGPNGGPCTACVAGKYKTTSGSAACTDCGTGSYISYSASSAAGDCTCNAGFTGPNGGVCSACVTGKYKISTGSAACTDCGAGSYSTSTGAPLAATCLVCPINTFSGLSASSCQACQANATSAAGSVSQAYCYCKSGYAHLAGSYTCRICDPGTYNSQLGRTACSNCSVGLYSVYYGATGNETCLSCPLGQWSPEGSPTCNLCPVNSRAAATSGSLSNCTCNAGYTGPNGGLCSARTNLTCSVCPGNTYYSGGACTSCMNNTVSVPGSLACQCKAGFTGSPDACQACPAGTYKRMAGTSACRSCQANSRSDTASALCSCNMGYTGNTGDVCVVCVAGKYKDVIGSAACTACASYRNSLVGSIDLTNCTCNSGYTHDMSKVNLARSCQTAACETVYGGISVAITASSALTDGNIDTISEGPGSASWIRIDFGRNISMDSLVLWNGNTWNHQYWYNYYAFDVSVFMSPSASLDSQAVQCVGPVAELWWTRQQLQSGSGYEKRSKTLNCANGSTVSGRYLYLTYTPGTWTWTAFGEIQVYVSAIDAQRLLISSQLTYEQPCAMCDVGKFKGTSGTQACTSCAQNQSSVTSSLICSCVAGFTGPDGGPCAQCAQGTYKDWLGSQACTTCPANSYTPATGNTLVVNCTCNTGYSGPNGVSCPACVGGTYKNVTGTSACIVCDANLYSSLPTAATSCTACNPGFQSLASSAVVGDCCDPNTTIARSPFFNLSTTTQAALGYYYSVRVSSTPLFGLRSMTGTVGKLWGPFLNLPSPSPASVAPMYIASGGYYGQPYLSFRKTPNVQYMDADEVLITFENGMTFVTVVRFLEYVQGMQYLWVGSLVSFMFADRSLGFEVFLTDRGCGPVLCVGRGFDYFDSREWAQSWQTADRSICTGEQWSCTGVIPLNQWLTVAFTYGGNSNPLHTLKVTYQLPSGAEVVVASKSAFVNGGLQNTPTMAQTISRINSPTYVCNYGNGECSGNFDARKYVLGYNTNYQCMQYYTRVLTSDIVTVSGGCDRPDFDLAGLYLMQTIASAADIAVILKGIRSGSQLAYDRTDCPCNAGFGGSGRSDCKSCVAGKYKSETSSIPCTSCPTNMYATAVQALSIDTCSSCPQSSVSISGESICFCAAGFTGPDGGPCVACAAGKYKNWRNSSSCPVCPSNSDSVPGTSLCPCNVGYTGPLGGPCIACVAGKYKDTNGTANCTTCPANSYEPDIGATLVTNCSCNTGFEGGLGGPCTACALGKYKSNNDSVPCVYCPIDTYIDVQASPYCKNCPSLTTASSNSSYLSACQCKQGYTGLGGSSTSGVNLARSCGADGATPCATTAWSGSGAFANDNFLQPFTPEGAWAINTVYGSDVWMYIDFGKVVEVRDFAMHVYGPNDNYPYMHRFWVYASNSTTPNGVNTLPFRYGGNWDDTGIIQDGSAQFCVRDVRRIAGTTTFGTCAPADFYVSPTVIWWDYYTSINRCTCGAPVFGRYLFVWNYPINPNYLTIIEWQIFGPPIPPCSACAIGKYKDTIGSTWCTSCPASTFSAETNATSIATCSSCQGNSTSLLGSASKDYCQCNTGFIHQGGGCVACLPGTYNPRLAQIACSNCTVGTYSLNYGAVSNETCASCSATEYSPEGSALCQPCPPNSVAAAGSSRIQDCGCTFGYTGATASLCEKCAPGSFKNITGNWLCQSCSVNSYSLSGATALTACFCNPGYTGAYGPLCVACAIGKYKSVYGSAACSDCPANTYADRTGQTVCTSCVNTSASPVGSVTVWNCTCNAGYKGPTYDEVAYHDNFARSCGYARSSACATTQSSTLTTQVMVGVYDFLNPANFANDNSSATFSTTAYGTGQWWRVDFERRVTVQAVRVLFSNFAFDTLYVLVGDANSSTANLICASVAVNASSTDWATATCASALTGRYLYVRNSIASQVTMKEIQVQGTEVLTKIWPDWCEKCPLGTYKSVTGSSACVACPSNRFSATLASTSISACLSCPSNSVAATGSDQCACDVGFSGAVNACTACGTDTFKTQVGASTCEVCPANSVIASNASTSAMPCTCLSGYQPS